MFPPNSYNSFGVDLKHHRTANSNGGLSVILKLAITNYSIGSRKIKNNCKIVLASDLHECDTDIILDEIRKYAPDMTVVPGDFVHREDTWKKGAAFLKSATEISRVFCSIGNHDRGIYDIAIKAIEAAHAELLDNEYVEYKSVKIGGLSSPTVKTEMSPWGHTLPPDSISWLDEFERDDGFKLLLCHHPEHFDGFIKGRDIDLTLSGHAHGGQWRIFGRGVFAPGQGLFPKYTSGVYADGHLIVGRGLGNPHSIPRINNDPELIFIDLFFDPDSDISIKKSVRKVKTKARPKSLKR